MFENSKTIIEGINYNEVVLYIALNKTQEEINDMRLSRNCPERKKKRGQRPNMTGCGSKDKENDMDHNRCQILQP